MKKLSMRLLGITLALVLALGGVLCVPVYARGTNQLRYGADGKFTIMQIADTQDDDTPQESMMLFIAKALDEVKPDLVIFTGDNVVGVNADAKEVAGITALTAPLVERSIPFTLTFGNHDHESGISEERQLEIYQSIPGCLAYDAVPELYGTGTHNLTILSSDGQRVVNNLWLIDSNEYDNELGGYDYVHEDQIQWYKSTANSLKTANGGKSVPSLNFQHIIVPEIYDFMYWAPFDTKISPKFNGSPRVPIIKLSNYFTGKFKGAIMELPCPSKTNSGQYQAWLDQGDVMAAFFGHDHINEFTANRDGIDLVNTPSPTFNSYGSYYTRGVRVIELDENNPDTYSTRMYRMVDAYGYGSGLIKMILENSHLEADKQKDFENRLKVVDFLEKVYIMPMYNAFMKAVINVVYGE